MGERYYTYNVYPTGKSPYRGYGVKNICQNYCTTTQALKAFKVLTTSSKQTTAVKTLEDVTGIKQLANQCTR